MIKHEAYKRAYVVEQLQKYGFNNTDMYTYDELVRKLAAARAMEVDRESSAEKWF